MSDRCRRSTIGVMLMLAARVWHAWIALPLFALAVLSVVAVIVGYLMKVVAPRYPRR